MFSTAKLLWLKAIFSLANWVKADFTDERCYPPRGGLVRLTNNHSYATTNAVVNNVNHWSPGGSFMVQE